MVLFCDTQLNENWPYSQKFPNEGISASPFSYYAIKTISHSFLLKQNLVERGFIKYWVEDLTLSCLTFAVLSIIGLSNADMTSAVWALLHC